MEQTALRPKPIPGQHSGGGAGRPAARRPGPARRRRRRFTTVLTGLLAGTVLVLAGAGLGTLGATVIGATKLAGLREPLARPGATASRSAPAAPPSPAPSARVTATLGVEAVDDEGPGARVVGVHVPGPGYSAGLVRGDVLLAVGRARVDSAADLARAVAGARAGTEVKLTVRHASGGYQQLTAVPGVVT
ncbi:PDZ domain-containing protein [Streptomyces sp. NPDC000134]|uniref:PDZ domain-containing protein n=1 Tax=Streptomyces sp. NPDC000134 TaxID=3364536 RepID=UPI0036AC3647